MIGYPVAYYVARHGRAPQGLLLVAARPAVLDQLPDADAGVGQPAADRRLRQRVLLELRCTLGCARNWLDGDWPTVVIGLIYGYMPFFILPLYAALERSTGG